MRQVVGRASVAVVFMGVSVAAGRTALAEPDVPGSLETGDAADTRGQLVDGGLTHREGVVAETLHGPLPYVTATASVTDRVELGLELPFWFSSSGDFQGAPAASVKIGVIRRPRVAFAVSGAAYFDTNEEDKAIEALRAQASLTACVGATCRTRASATVGVVAYWSTGQQREFAVAGGLSTTTGRGRHRAVFEAVMVALSDHGDVGDVGLGYGGYRYARGGVALDVGLALGVGYSYEDHGPSRDLAALPLPLAAVTVATDAW